MKSIIALLTGVKLVKILLIASTMCAEEAGFSHCFDINAAFAQALYNGSGNVFVEREPNFPRHSACA